MAVDDTALQQKIDEILTVQQEIKTAYNNVNQILRALEDIKKVSEFTETTDKQGNKTTTEAKVLPKNRYTMKTMDETFRQQVFDVTTADFAKLKPKIKLPKAGELA